MNASQNEECKYKTILDVVDPHILTNTFNYTILRFMVLTKNKPSHRET